MADSFWDKEEEIFKAPKGRDELLVHKCEKNGAVFYNIREYYTDKEGELKPSKKGIAIPEELFKNMLDSIQKGE